MSAQPVVTLTYAAFLELERSSPTKHEYLRGQVWDMAGGTPTHALLQVNAAALLRQALRGRPCAVYSSDLRVRVDDTDRSTYPDVTVICGTRQHSPVDPDAIINPSVIVEVLSDTTEASDRGEKFAHFRYLPSLQEYVLISQDRRSVEVFRRMDDGSWAFRAYTHGNVPLASLEISLSMEELYEDPNAAR